MEYTFTDLDKRTYQRNATEPITVESKITADRYIELSLADAKGIFFVLKINDREAAAISSAVVAGRAKCTSRILVGNILE